MQEITLRFGTRDDIEFVIDCILEAESAGTAQSSYQKIFNMGVPELRESFKMMLEEEAPGCEINYSNYIIACCNAEPVGGMAAWIEGEGMQGSNIIRAGLFSYFIPREKWLAAQPNLKMVSQIDIPRVAASLQFEDGYVLSSFRGNQILQKIFRYGVQQYYKLNPDLKLAQGFSLAGNIQSHTSMTKIKWKEMRSTTFENDIIKNLLPGSGKIQWELDLTDPLLLEFYGIKEN